MSKSALIDWAAIDTLLLDMDGTLLDLHFDNHFWLEHMPRRYAERRGLPLEEARLELLARYRQVEGTLDWYSVDYWSRELGLDVPLLKQEVDHLIAVHPHVVAFLDAIRALGKDVVLVTNAHFKSLELKMEKTRLGGHFDRVICSHDLGLPKEDPGFWPLLRGRRDFDPERSLLVDDSLAVLHSARQFGIGYLVSVSKPDSTRPKKLIADFQAIEDFRELMAGL